LAFSSSHHETRYITQLSINANTATTATYCIICAITFVARAVHIFRLTFGAEGFAISASTQPGSHIQFRIGASAKTFKKSNCVLTTVPRSKYFTLLIFLNINIISVMYIKYISKMPLYNMSLTLQPEQLFMIKI